MDWKKSFSQTQQPTQQQIAAFIDSELWEKLNSYLQQAYDVKPKYSYSRCSMQAGWNIKYTKGKSLCTLYPMAGYFIMLVVIGKKEMAEAEELMPLLSAHTQRVFQQTPVGQGPKWLMLEIKTQEILEDAIKLVALRREPKNQMVESQ